MFKKKIIVRFRSFVIMACLINLAVAQNPIGSVPGANPYIFGLFQSGDYQSVVQYLDRKAVLGLYEQYLLEMSSIRLGSEDVTPLEQLLAKNPKYPLNEFASYTLGDFHFHRKDWRKAASYLKRVDGSDLTTVERSNHYFMRGYLAMQNEQYQEAGNYFKRAVSLTGKTGKLSYYQGFVSYHLNDKAEALTHFDGAKELSEFETSANFFTAKIRLENNEYDEVISAAQSQLSEEVSVTNSGFYQVIGEAYALKGQADKASNYFNKAIELHPSKPSAALYYQAGVANFKLGLEKKAIEYFTESGIRSGDYAHLSAFQLGRLYLSQDDKVNALSAYIEASASSDLAIQEEAYFQAGKIHVDLQNFSEGINYLNDYLDKFAEGKWKKEAQQLLAESYLRTSNYDQAIEHIEEVGLTVETRSIYQKVCFQKAQLLFSDGEFASSITWFSKGMVCDCDLQQINEANYLMAEAHFSLGNFKAAIKSYQAQEEPDQRSWYGLGYAYYNLKNYLAAIPHFEKLLKTTTAARIRIDAELRLADCYYATKSYEKALTTYERLSRSSPTAYVYYQLGLVNGNLERDERASGAFDRVLKLEDTGLHDDATFQIGMLRFEAASFDQAEFHFSSLISKFPSSPLMADATLNRAVSRTNLGKLEEASADYQSILENHLQSPIAFNAILGLQELQGKGLKIKNLEDQIAKYRKANPDSKSLEVVEFEFAKSQYFNLSYETAISSLNRFISEYPESVNVNEATYYLADAQYRTGKLKESLETFMTIRNSGDRAGRILARVGDINYQMQDFNQALEAYKLLIDLNQSPKDTYNGWLGMMNAYVAQEQFQLATATADTILGLTWLPLNADRNAMLVKARSFLELGDSGQAAKSFESLADGNDAISAEAAYMMAVIQFDQANYQESLDLLFEFNKRFGSYPDWIDKSYLLIADNYIAREELFQAKATLRSIVQHSENEETKAMAQNRLNGIENLTEEDTTSNQN